MIQAITETQVRAGGFATVAAADRAIRRLIAAGFSKDQLIVVCPARFQNQLRAEAPQAESPTADPGKVIAVGGIIGATLGGLALAATALTGGAAGIVGGVLIGGGAIAGGISNLIVSKGYEQEIDDYFKEAVQQGWIVVGVAVPDAEGVGKRATVERILNDMGAKPLVSMQDNSYSDNAASGTTSI